MRVLVVLYHVGDALAREMERQGVGPSDVRAWCADWEESVTGCSDTKNLGWLRHADELVRRIRQYHEYLQDMEVIVSDEE